MDKRMDIKHHFKVLCLDGFSLPVAFNDETLGQRLGHVWYQNEPSG